MPVCMYTHTPISLWPEEVFWLGVLGFSMFRIPKAGFRLGFGSSTGSFAYILRCSPKPVPIIATP